MPVVCLLGLWLCSFAARLLRSSLRLEVASSSALLQPAVLVATHNWTSRIKGATGAAAGKQDTLSQWL
jgi:hypothetical protein